MLTATTIMTFMTACAAIIIAPGPAQALVLSRSISDGRKAGILTALGLNIGTVFHAIIAALGLSAILATSALAFSIVKYIGAAYLLYLGMKAFLQKGTNVYKETRDEAEVTKALPKAIITGVLNPKVAIFFLAFLPQFVDPERGYVFWQFIILGSILALMDIVYEGILVLIAGLVNGWFSRNERFNLWRQRFTGLVLIGLGLRLAFVQQE